LLKCPLQMPRLGLPDGPFLAVYGVAGIALLF